MRRQWPRRRRLVPLLVAAGLSALPPARAADLRLDPLPFASALALQTRLDRLNLSCGCLDGRIGSKTRAALDMWRQQAGLSPAEVTPQLLAATLGAEVGILTEHVVTADAFQALTPACRTWAERAAQPVLGYATILESVAERYHAAEDAIRRLNPGLAWPDPPPGTRLRVPNPFPARSARATRLHISLARKRITALDAEGNVAAFFPCTIAAVAEKRPVGALRITTLIPNPNYTFDPARFPEDPDAQSLAAKAMLAPGPNNPVGTVWIGLDRPGYGIHGTPHPEAVGRAASHGCFRLTNWDAEKLLGMSAVGLPVMITEE